MAVRDFRGRIERLDQSYLDDLIRKAQKGDSNAFAELFASVSDRLLSYLNFLFGDRESAVRAVETVFTSALRNLPALTEVGLFMVWISRIASGVYYDETGRERAVNREYSLSQMLNLPLAESQIIMMTHEQGLKPAEAAELLNISTRTVKRFRKLARRHLVGNELEAEGSDQHTASAEGGYGSVTGGGLERISLGPVEAAEILDRVFGSCSSDPNSVPMEALSSYAVYRSERFSLQRGILAAALALFILLPLLFVLPSYTVSVEEKGERGLPVYTIDVQSIMPVGRVLAAVRNHALPVYEANARKYTVEPTRNGTLEIEVALVNRQSVKQEAEVSAVDSESPVLKEQVTGEDTFLLKAEDTGIGINYRKIYAKGESGKIYYPIEASDEAGIEFEYPEENWDIFIPDHIGNTLHLSLKLK